jgi:hypothetical protein
MNRTFTIIIGIIFLVALLGFAAFFVPNTPKEEASPEAAQDLRMYENAAHGFSITYPATLDLLEYTPDMAAIGTQIPDGIDGVVDVRVMIVMGEPGESYEDALARELANLCAADGPDSSFSCTGVARTQPFAGAQGAEGVELFLAGALTERGTGAVTTIEKGPYYAFVLDGGATATKVLVVHAPLNQSAAEADAATIRAVAETVSVSR